MVKSHAGRGALLSSNLPQLQNLIKRDPKAYREEFLQQWNHYHSILKIFQASHNEETESFRDIVAFISQLAPFYPDVTANFPAEISSLLLENYGALDPEMRKSLISNLIILRKKDVIPATELLKTLFPLLPRTTSSTLRSYIRKTILTEIRTANQKRNNLKLNRAVQAMLFRMLEQGADAPVVQGKGKQPARDTSSGDALWAIFVTKDLWKKGTWNDAKSVSIVSMGCFHPSVKVQSASLHFFLDEEDEHDSSDEDEDIPDPKSLEHRRTINKKTRSGDKKIVKQLKNIKKKRKKAAAEDNRANFAALHLINDPQTFAEKLYDNLNRNDKRYLLDHKLLILQVMCRTMGTHKLCVLGYYTYIMKYLSYHQLRITTFLLSLAQSVHDLTPPDVLTPVIRKIAQEFVHPGVGNEVIAAGINTIREVCKRQPWCMEEDLLADLVEYKKSKDKGVMVASRSLLQLYRQTIPSMLKRRERGKEASMKGDSADLVPFGHQDEGVTQIEGLDLLESHLKKAREQKAEGDGGDENDGSQDEEDEWAGWEVDSDSESESSESEGWIDVSSDENDLVLSDSEDDDEDVKNKRSAKGVSEKDQEDTEMKDGTEEISAPSNPLELATTKILTPADFALLNDLRQQAAKEETGSKRKHAALQNTTKEATAMTEDDIVGPRKKAKATYEERMESIMKGREDREKFGSAKGKKKKEAPSSTTNKQKQKNKPIMMVLASGAVRGKKKASLREKQKRLRAHTENQKKRKH